MEITVISTKFTSGKIEGDPVLTHLTLPIFFDKYHSVIISQLPNIYKYDNLW